MRGQRGFSLFELILVLVIATFILGGIALVGLPLIEKTKIIIAKHDLQAIATAIYAFRGDVREWPIWKDGRSCRPADGGSSATKAFNVLKSADGSEPAVDGVNALAADWLDINSDTLENQLVLGAPGLYVDGALFGDILKRYPDKSSATANHFKGPYLQSGFLNGLVGSGMFLPKDPWGNKYYVNIKFLQPEHLAHGTPNREVVFVISAGPNETLETKFNQDLLQGGPGGGAFKIGGDDVVFLIGAN